jgi:hypothetical protein
LVVLQRNAGAVCGLAPAFLARQSAMIISMQLSPELVFMTWQRAAMSFNGSAWSQSHIKAA